MSISFVSSNAQKCLRLTLTPVKIEKPFRDVLENLIDQARALCPGIELHSFLTPPPPPDLASSNAQPLHISLTHPLPLRRNQRRPIHNDVVHQLSKHEVKAFKLSMAGTVRVYFNGRRYGGEGSGGRAFLALRVGAGSSEVCQACGFLGEAETDQLGSVLEKIIHPILRPLHLSLYQENPEFHASFAWCLLHSIPPLASAASSDGHIDSAESEASSDPAHSPFTEATLHQLNNQFERSILNSQPPGGWTIDAIQLKISKDVIRIPLKS